MSLYHEGNRTPLPGPSPQPTDLVSEREADRRRAARRELWERIILARVAGIAASAEFDRGSLAQDGAEILAAIEAGPPVKERA